MDSASVLIVGAAGMAGRDLLACRPGATGLDLPDIDLTDADSCRRVLDRIRPELVVNCAAATGVDWCESNRDAAMRVNAAGAGHLAAAAREVGALIVQLSTDYVFDGTWPGEYVEDHPPSPLCVYAESKLEGERAIVAATSNHLILRIGWLFGHADKSFVRYILRQAGRDGPVPVIDDQVGCPTYSYDIAEAIDQLVAAGATGTVHFTNTGPCTRFEMARYIFERMGLDPDRLTRITSSDLPWVAKRPARTVLATAKYRRLTDIAPRRWQAAIDAALERDGHPIATA